MPVYQYKQKYYLYYPADLGDAGRRTITDSTICYSTMDGRNPRAIVSEIKKDRTTWDFKVKLSSAMTSRIIIHIIDQKTKLAVWENRDAKSPQYGLYIPAENAKAYDMIVNYTKGDLPDEFEFDQINYKKLLGTEKH